MPSTDLFGCCWKIQSNFCTFSALYSQSSIFICPSRFFILPSLSFVTKKESERERRKKRSCNSFEKSVGKVILSLKNFVIVVGWPLRLGYVQWCSSSPSSSVEETFFEVSKERFHVSEQWFGEVIRFQPIENSSWSFHILPLPIENSPWSFENFGRISSQKISSVY